MRKNLNLRANIALGLIFAFLLNTFGPVPMVQANEFALPAVGMMVYSSPAYTPVMIRGMRIHPDNPLLFDFILDTGKSGLDINSAKFKIESQKLIKYFLAALTIKGDDLWVNLSPYEKDRTIPKGLDKTELGRDMLAQDYILKQLTASLIYPEKDLGKEFWENVYTKTRQVYGATSIPVNTFNKVWIVADKARVLERNHAAYIVGAHLKVMLEDDYLAFSKHQSSTRGHPHSIASQVIRKIILPEIEKDVNEGRNFAPLRQMFYSMILASWYKLALKNTFLDQVYSNKGKTGGVLSDDPVFKEKIYQQYLKAYKKGVFNYIKEDATGPQQSVPRKYFSGGIAKNLWVDRAMQITHKLSTGDNIRAVGKWAMVAVFTALLFVPLKGDQEKLTPITTQAPVISMDPAINIPTKKAENIVKSISVEELKDQAPGITVFIPPTNGRYGWKFNETYRFNLLEGADPVLKVDNLNATSQGVDIDLRTGEVKSHTEEPPIEIGSPLWYAKLSDNAEDPLQAAVKILKGKKNRENAQVLRGYITRIETLRDQMSNSTIDVPAYQIDIGKDPKAHDYRFSMINNVLKVEDMNPKTWQSWDVTVDLTTGDLVTEWDGSQYKRGRSSWSKVLKYNVLIPLNKAIARLEVKNDAKNVKVLGNYVGTIEKLIHPASNKKISQIDPPKVPGGIDFNSKNMRLEVDQNGERVEMKFDANMIIELKKGAFTGLQGIIIKIVPFDGLLSAFGFNLPMAGDKLAKQ